MALPLEGVRVLDLTSVMAGPYCTMVLGDMGAEVIKIENFPEGDASRRFDPKVNDESYCFAVLNRNKKSVALNMKAESLYRVRLMPSASAAMSRSRIAIQARPGRVRTRLTQPVVTSVSSASKK